MTRKDVYVVPHCHWDAEWYFTCEDSHILLIENIDYLLDLLESREDFPSYIFDGLSIVLDEYLQIRPENAGRLRKLIRERRLQVGPWYTQCDSLLIRTESLIRNLQCGINIAEGFGHSMNIGYMPDIFGQHTWLPALYRDLGIEYCVLQRGVYTDQLDGDLNFKWQAPNQVSIATNYLYYGYGPGKFLAADDDYLTHRLLPILQRLGEMNSHTDNLLLPCGGDQVLPNALFPQTVEKLNQLGLPYHFKMASYEDYMEETWREHDFSHTIEGELYACQKSRIHRTCHSTRYDIKRQTWQTEHLLLDKLEPLTVIASQLNIHWPEPLMEELWKKVFSAHAHNGIEASNADAVNHNIIHRLMGVERSALSLINLLKKKISHSIAATLGESNILVVFNCDLHPHYQLVSAVVFTQQQNFTLSRNGVTAAHSVVSQQRLSGGQRVIVTAAGEKLEAVEDYWRSEILFPVSDLNGLGYQTWQVNETASAVSVSLPQLSQSIENDCYRVDIDNGDITLTDRHSGERYPALLHFSDCADDGDEFDFAPLEHDTPLTASPFKVIAAETLAHTAWMTLECSLQLPSDITHRRAKERDQSMTIRTRLELRQGENWLRVQHELTNAACDHRLRVHLNTPISSPQFSWADQGFSLVRRETVSRYVDGWREKGFVEKPVPIYTMENGVFLRDDTHCVGVLTKGIKEYEVLPENNALALTLFRSVGLLGKDDTPWRPGRASGINNKVVPTPDAQMLQTMVFDYAVFITPPQSDTALFSACTRYRERYLTYQFQALNTFEERLERFTLPMPSAPQKLAAEWLSLSNPQIQVSLCKPGSIGEITLRLFNPGEQEETFSLTSPYALQLWRVSLRDEKQEPLSGEITLRPCDYLTLSLALAQ
ncbi:MAG: glycoside hydrolase family 38 C-terminal domain-containing protein [Scandinavium sp.]|uniref:glycoside hydrolase family 38 N-terminal domain-containing protein n=1 Tax=Scandinavium sp. TaxID=2830653 RepID=UPI003F3BB404